MAINTDGQKRQGRFLKKNSKILSAVSMVEFNFEEICAHPLVTFDNPDRSIIHSKFHNPELLDTVVKPHSSMDEKVHDPSVPQLGVIFPADFTQDWHNERLNSKRRALGYDEEDEIDFAEVARNRGRSGVVPIKQNTSQNHDNQTESEHQAAHREPQSAPVIQVHSATPEVMNVKDEDGKVRIMTENDMSQAIDKAFTHPVEETSQESAPETEFTPLPTKDGSPSLSLEDKAIENWKAQQEVAKKHEEILDQLKSQARLEGYQAGFREGEEKGLMSGQRTASQVFGKVSEVIKEFEGLKGLVLENVQRNFYELSQAIGEALLGREFNIRPEAYAQMIERVIKDTVQQDEFKIRLHPDTWQKIHDLKIDHLDSRLVKDPSIPLGEFRVESQMTVVDVSAKKLVEQLLQNVDINLFDEKKAG